MSIMGVTSSPSASAVNHWDTTSSFSCLFGESSTVHEKTLLPKGFVPSAKDVIIGRGRKITQHKGNEQFRTLVAQRLAEYSVTNSRIEKSYIIQTIVKNVRAEKGGFVKLDATNQRWYEIGDEQARERTSQTFRDFLSEQYASSNVTKKRARQRGQTTTATTTTSDCTSPQAAAAAQATTTTVTKNRKTGRHSSVGSKDSYDKQQQQPTINHNNNNDSMTAIFSSFPSSLFSSSLLPVVETKASLEMKQQYFLSSQNTDANMNLLYGASSSCPPSSLCHMKANVTNTAAVTTTTTGCVSQPSKNSGSSNEQQQNQKQDAQQQLQLEAQQLVEQQGDYPSPLQAVLAINNWEIPCLSSSSFTAATQTKTSSTATAASSSLDKYMQELLCPIGDDFTFTYQQSSPSSSYSSSSSPLVDETEAFFTAPGRTPAAAAATCSAFDTAATTCEDVPSFSYFSGSCNGYNNLQDHQLLADLEPLPIRSASFSSSCSSASILMAYSSKKE